MNRRGLFRAVAVLVGLAAEFPPAAGDVLLAQVPAGSDVLAEINVREIMRSGFYRDLKARAGEQFGDWLALQSRFGIPEDKVVRVLIVDNSRVKRERGVLLETTLPENELVKLLTPHGLKSMPLPGGKNAYLFPLPQARSLPEEKQELLELAYLAPNVILIEEPKYFNVFYVARSGKRGDSEMLKAFSRLPADRPFRLLARPAPRKKGDAKNPFSGVTGKAQQFSVLGNFTGSARDGIAVQATAECADPRQAAELQMRANTLLLFGLSVLFGNNPELGAEVQRGIRLGANGKSAVAELTLQGETIRKILVYLEQELKRGREIGDNPVPIAE